MTSSMSHHDKLCNTLVECLLGKRPKAVNNDFSRRVVQYAAESLWQASATNSAEVRVLEYFPGQSPRLTAFLRTTIDTEAFKLPADALELVLIAGKMQCDEQDYNAGYYLRNPWKNKQQESYLVLGGQSSTSGPFNRESNSTIDQHEHEQAIVYVCAGQLEHSDKEERRINILDPNRWLPGPVEGTEVMPLHMHKGNNAMLIRWLSTAHFTPKLDPRGEEVFVLEGELQDEVSRYPEGSWIRNPITSWQCWSGDAGTVIYYKNGHFDSVAA